MRKIVRGGMKSLGLAAGPPAVLVENSATSLEVKRYLLCRSASAALRPAAARTDRLLHATARLKSYPDTCRVDQKPERWGTRQAEQIARVEACCSRKRIAIATHLSWRFEPMDDYQMVNYKQRALALQPLWSDNRYPLHMRCEEITGRAA